MAKTVAGYTDKMSVAPGERLSFMVSCEEGVPVCLKYKELFSYREGCRGGNGPCKLVLENQLRSFSKPLLAFRFRFFLA